MMGLLYVLSVSIAITFGAWLYQPEFMLSTDLAVEA